MFPGKGQMAHISGSAGARVSVTPPAQLCGTKAAADQTEARECDCVPTGLTRGTLTFQLATVFTCHQTVSSAI